MIHQILMIRTLVNQLGLQVNMVIKPAPELLLDMEQRSYNVFHVPEVLSNPAIPALREFVIPLPFGKNPLRRLWCVYVPLYSMKDKRFSPDEHWTARVRHGMISPAMPPGRGAHDRRK